MKTTEKADQARADEIFDAMSDYGRGQLAVYGTAFTTYEDEGANVCAWLNARCRSWRCARLTAAERKA